MCTTSAHEKKREDLSFSRVLTESFPKQLQRTSDEGGGLHLKKKKVDITFPRVKF